MTRLATVAFTAVLLMPAGVAAQQAPAPASAPAPSTTPSTAAPAVGAMVYDTTGAPVGTITAMSAGAVTIDTGAHKVPVPATSVGPGAKGLVMAMSKMQLDAAYNQATAQATAQMRAKLVPGTAVSSLHGAATVGTIKSADDQYVTLTTPKGEVKLPVAGFSTNAQGKVIVGMTADQFNAAVGGSGGTTAPATTPPAG